MFFIYFSIEYDYDFSEEVSKGLPKYKEAKEHAVGYLHHEYSFVCSVTVFTIRHTLTIVAGVSKYLPKKFQDLKIGPLCKNYMRRILLRCTDTRASLGILVYCQVLSTKMCFVSVSLVWSSYVYSPRILASFYLSRIYRVFQL